MVDKALFLGTNGAKAAMHRLELITNNLANVSTTGFRADYEMMKNNQVGKNDKSSRAYSEISGTFSDFHQGPILKTGRDLDVAISGDGFIAVQTAAGKEAYTRAGDLQIKNGLIMTQAGEVVLGNGGVMNVSGALRVNVGADGTVSLQRRGETTMSVANRIKLVKPKVADLKKGPDGLFYSLNGSAMRQDDSVKLVTGAIEGSNVNPVETLTSLIDLSRNFEMNTNLMKSIESNAQKANELLSLPR